MKKITILLAGFGLLFMMACGGESTTKDADITKEVAVETPAPTVEPEPVADYSAGEAIYNGKGTCFACHQANGEGLATFPPLANADYLVSDIQRAVKQTIYGSKEPITVNGVEYAGGVMTTVELTDQEVMDVVNYILNSWGNAAGTVSLEDVAAAR